jgi:hypothetical protein
MTEDARYEDAGETAVRLVAAEPDDVPVISALLQDAVFPITEMTWDRRRRRFALLVNRFRWEDRAAAERRGRPFERVRALLVACDVLRVTTQGLDVRDRDTILSLLALAWEPGPDGTGRLVLTLAGDGAIALDVECLDLTLNDVTRPYIAPSRKAPHHPD